MQTVSLGEGPFSGKKKTTKNKTNKKKKKNLCKLVTVFSEKTDVPNTHPHQTMNFQFFYWWPWKLGQGHQI